MKSLLFRINRRIQMTVTSFRSDCQFSLYYALLRIADELGSRLGFTKLSAIAHQKKDNYIFCYLKNSLQQVLDSCKESTDPGVCAENPPIWVCWWTGEDTAPPLVKRCIQSIRENAGSHPVHLISRKNYGDYLQIPSYILDRVDQKQMGLAHLADYIRVSLLNNYGGLWLDATIFCSQKIPEDYFSYPFFTCKSPPQPVRYISKMQWTTFVLGGWSGNTFYRVLQAMMELYWKNNKTAIDYLFFDHLIFLAKSSVPFISTQMDQVPNNNPHRDDLQAAMNDALPGDAFGAVIQPDTILYKLSWREHYLICTELGSPTIFARFLDN